MRFRWDWLGPVVTVPYVPTLGPVNPEVLSVDLFEAAVSVADTGRFLPYDKDRRWSRKKDDRIIVSEIVHRPGHTAIPTFSPRGGGTVKVFCYGNNDQALSEWARKLCAAHGASNCRLHWFNDRREGATGRLMLKTFTDADDREPTGVMHMSSCEVADTFPAFADQLGVDGFAFLYQRMKAGHDDGPVLVAVEDRRIVGAIGPLGTIADVRGVPQQPPQYFAVHPDYRNRGHGTALWRASMAWGRRNGARYKILQASVGSAAERLYLSHGLATHGFVHASPIGV